MMKKILIALGATAMLASASANAADDFFDPKFRVGVGLGHGKLDLDVGSNLRFTGSATAWEIYGGLELNRWLAIEAGYVDAGEAEKEFFDMIYAIDTTAFYASVIGSLPLNDYVSLYGRAGLLSWKSDQMLRFEGEPLATGKNDGQDPYFGAGVSAMIDQALLRLEYRMADLDDTKFTMLNLSMVWRF